MQKMIEYLSEVKIEAKKINWPSREQVTRYTLIVIAISAFVAVLLGGLDFIFGIFFRKIIVGL